VSRLLFWRCPRYVNPSGKTSSRLGAKRGNGVAQRGRSWPRWRGRRVLQVLPLRERRRWWSSLSPSSRDAPCGLHWRRAEQRGAHCVARGCSRACYPEGKTPLEMQHHGQGKLDLLLSARPTRESLGPNPRTGLPALVRWRGTSRGLMADRWKWGRRGRRG
jgi:hypothetical protein